MFPLDGGAHVDCVVNPESFCVLGWEILHVVMNQMYVFVCMVVVVVVMMMVLVEETFDGNCIPRVPRLQTDELFSLPCVPRIAVYARRLFFVRLVQGFARGKVCRT